MTFRSLSSRSREGAGGRAARALAAACAGAAGVALAGLAGMADASSPTTLTTAANSSLAETIVVDSHGLTVYELRPESAHHLLCTKANGCFSVWRPVTVASARTKLTAGRGVSGRLAVLHRSAVFQVTLGGHPLYRYAGDGSTKGAARGQGLHSFGGTWHVVVGSQAASPPVTTTTPTTTTTTPTTPTTPTVPYYPPLPY